MKQKNKNKGITLIALIITIILLLILAGVTIGQLTGNGLFDKVKLAKEKSEQTQKEENQILDSYVNEIANITGNRDTITLSTEEYNKLKNANNYSEDEIEIGTWIDGKKVYRKVLLNNTLTSIKPNIWENYYLAKELNIETLVNGRFGRKKDGKILDIMSDVNVWYDSSTNYISINRSFTLDFPNYSAVIIEYTKTTD